MKKKTKIIIFNEVEQLSKYFAKKLIKGIGKTADDEYYTIALSGGSTPRAIFKYLASNYKNSIDWQKLQVFWGDERCVPPDDDDSNFKMASESLLNNVAIPKENTFRIKGEENPEDEAKRYAELISKKVRSHDGYPRFDMIMLGLGTDGHTASIFPDSQHLFDHDKLCAVVQHPESKQTRITITGDIINHAKTAAFIATGESKAIMVATIIDQKEGWEKLPASKVDPEKGRLLWLLDDQSAAKLKTKS